MAGAAILVLIALLHLGTGFVGRNWVVLLLVPAAVGLAYPAGYPSTSEGEPLPIWFGMLVFSPVGLALMAMGIIAAKLVPRRGPRLPR